VDVVRHRGLPALGAGTQGGYGQALQPDQFLDQVAALVVFAQEMAGFVVDEADAGFGYPLAEGVVGVAADVPAAALYRDEAAEGVVAVGVVAVSGHAPGGVVGVALGGGVGAGGELGLGVGLGEPAAGVVAVAVDGVVLRRGELAPLVDLGELAGGVIAVVLGDGGFDELDFPVQAVGAEVRQAVAPGPAGDRAEGGVADAGQEGLAVHGDRVDFAMGVSIEYVPVCFMRRNALRLLESYRLRHMQVGGLHLI